MMDWPYLVKKYRLDRNVTGVVHCGAHTAEEAPDYAQIGVPVWWIEANPNLTARIEAAIAPYPEQRLISALLYDVDGQDVTLNVSGPGYDGSSSVLDWGTHRTFSDLEWVDSVTRRSVTLNTLWETVCAGFPGANMLVTDLQGADGMVLSAAGCLLEQVQFVMCEVNTDEVYQGCMRLPDLDALLASVDPGPGFDRVETLMCGDQGWGDALYLRGGQQWR